MSDVVETTEHPSGGIPVPMNKAWDVSSIVTDGLFGLIANGHQVKIQLVEHFPTEGEICARHVVNLVFQSDQFLKFATTLNEIAIGLAIPPVEASE